MADDVTNERAAIIIEGRADGVAQRLLELYMGADVGPSDFAVAHMLDAVAALPGITGNWDFGFRRFEPSSEPRWPSMYVTKRVLASERIEPPRRDVRASKQHRIKGAR